MTIQTGSIWRVNSTYMPLWRFPSVTFSPLELHKGNLLIVAGKRQTTNPNTAVLFPDTFTVFSKIGVMFCFDHHITRDCSLIEARPDWVPPRMPAPLLQELYWPDPWKVTVICIMLNCTQRKQVEPMIDTFFAKYPNAETFIKEYERPGGKDEIVDLIKPLGFYNRRALTIFKFSKDLLSKGLFDFRSLHGVGKYANSCYEMLFLGKFEEEAPDDHALKDYHAFCKSQGVF